MSPLPFTVILEIGGIEFRRYDSGFYRLGETGAAPGLNESGDMTLPEAESFMGTLLPERFDTLPAPLARTMKLARLRGHAENRVATNGSIQRTREKTVFWNDLLAWHRAGKPAAELPALKAREAAMRRAGTF